jgi:hypothetical protein
MADTQILLGGNGDHQILLVAGIAPKGPESLLSH